MENLDLVYQETSDSKARRIPGRPNVVADKLSRLGQTIQTEWFLLPEVFHSMQQVAPAQNRLFYCVNTSYPMDNSLSGRRGPARQTSEKDVLCLHRLGRPSTVHSPDGVSYFLPV